MHHVALALAGFAVALPTFAPKGTEHIEVRLIADSTSPKPGGSVLIGLQMTPQPGWHGYWSNPGEAGVAPVVKWTAPAGVRFGSLQHPAPTLLNVQGLTSYVHAGPHVLISRMAVSSGVPLGTALPIKADVSWAACSNNLCVPEKATLFLQMTAGDAEPSVDAATLRRAVAAEPKSAGPGVFQVQDGKLLLQLPAHVRVNAQARFFPDENGWIDPAEESVVPGLPPRLAIRTTGPVPSRITGVVSDGSAAYRLSFRRGAFASARVEAEAPPAAALKATRTEPVREERHANVVGPSRKPEPRRNWTELSAALGLVGLAVALFLRRSRSSASS